MMATVTGDAPVERLQAAIWDRVNRNLRVPQSWYDRLEELKKQEQVAPTIQASTEAERGLDGVILPCIATLREELRELGARLRRGAAWLKGNPEHVATLPLPQHEAEGRILRQGDLSTRWQAKTETGRSVLSLYLALDEAHKAALQVLVCDQQIRKLEEIQAGNPALLDAERAKLIRLMDQLWGRWDTARAGVEVIEERMGA